ncbi:PIN domain-like protein [Mycena crocata]|nr:PIN domain-like protein [Mycena crocata]
MGIKGLWKELEPIEQKISLHNLAVSTGFRGNATGMRGFRVGIDASGWMYRACALHGTTENPREVALFGRCRRVHGLPILPFFIFDGDGRPDEKRGMRINGNDHPLTGAFQRMLDGFGFDWMVAPGEAEATLAEMTTSGIPVRVDAILTDDSDAFVFGASNVLRMRSEDNENYEASLYSASDISTMLGLSRDDFILIAILAGGDYSVGLPNCGVATAIALAHAGLGRQLIAGLTGQSRRASMVFLDTWRELLRSELANNTSGHLPRLYKKLARNIPAGFPDLDVINLYRHPIISVGPASCKLEFHPPRLDILAAFAEDYFHWGHSIGILEHITEQLVPGLVIRELVWASLAMDGLAPPSNAPSIIQRAVLDRRHKSTGHLAELRLLLNLDPAILTTALQAITGRRDPPGAQLAVTTWIADSLPKIRVWAPKSMVEHVYPSLVLDYVCTQGKRTGPQKRMRTAGTSESSTSVTPPEAIGSRKRTHTAVTSAASSSSVTSRRVSVQRGSPLEKAASSNSRSEPRYTVMSVIHRGEEVLELITDSEGEL